MNPIYFYKGDYIVRTLPGSMEFYTVGRIYPDSRTFEFAPEESSGDFRLPDLDYSDFTFVKVKRSGQSFVTTSEVIETKGSKRIAGMEEMIHVSPRLFVPAGWKDIKRFPNRTIQRIDKAAASKIGGILRRVI